MELATSTRTVFGKSLKALRKKGILPATFYGHGMENKSIELNASDFKKLFKTAGENTVITLLLEGKKQASLVYDVQYQPVTGEIVHVDFYGVRMDQKITAQVPLEFTGEAPAVKEKGGIVSKIFGEIEVESLPADLPHALVVDLSGLTELNQTIYVRDIKAPKNVKILLDEDTAVVNIAEPAPEEEITPPVMDVSDVKVESEEKKAERSEDKEAETNA